MQDLATLSLGLRRLGADLEFLRLLQYYGTEEAGVPERVAENGGGRYPEVLPRTLRLLDLDPFFTPAALFAAGALAFNLDRPDEAVILLQTALRRHPQQWRYHAYLAAVGYQKARDPEQVMRVLEPFVWEPDCPTLVKNQVAFLMRHAGRLDEARKLYRNILDTTADQGYKEQAERALRVLGNPTQPPAPPARPK